MTTTIVVSIFDGEEWKTAWAYETLSNVKPAEVSICFENDDWKIWGCPEDLIEDEVQEHDEISENT